MIGDIQDKKLIDNVFLQLDKRGIHYCIVRGIEKVDEFNVSGEVDIVILKTYCMFCDCQK